MFIRDAPKEIDNSHKDSCSKVTTEIFTVTVKMKMKLKLTLHKYKQQLHHYLPHCQLSWWHLYHLEHNYLLNIHTYKITTNTQHTEPNIETLREEASTRKWEGKRKSKSEMAERVALCWAPPRHTETLRCDRILT